jgi:membrane-bound serine protease (ClpP class)
MELLLNPNVGYLVVMLAILVGVLAILSPGTGWLELTALLVILLAGYEFYSLPVNAWAFLIMLAGGLPLYLAVQRADMRWLAVGMGLALLGAALLFRGPESWLGVSPLLSLVASVLLGGFLWGAARSILAAARTPPVQSLERLLGAIGETRTPVHQGGSVYVGGELWSAASREPIPAQRKVRVVGREGFLLLVELA